MEDDRKNNIVIYFTLFLLFFLPLGIKGQNLQNIQVSINADNKALHKVLDDLSNQCHYNFTFDSRIIESNKPINLNVNNLPLSQVLDSIFDDPDLTYKIINRNIVIFPTIKEPAAPIQALSSPEKKALIEINGQVSDTRSGKALAFASIGVADTYYGTVSNNEGKFTLRIPDTISNPVLISSYIGYESKYTAISISSEEPVLIKMKRNFISIQEVIIRYQDPVTLLAEAVNKITKNYLDEASGMNVYYRERVSKDDKCMIFSEAVVEIAKAPYNSSFMQEKSKLIKGRRITNVDHQDTVLIKVKSGLSTMLQLDIIKNLPDFLLEDFPLRYDLHFSSIVSFKDKLVYVISFKQKDHIDETLFKGDIYLDRESLAIIAADFEYDPVRIGREQNMFVARRSKNIRIRPTDATYHVEYDQLNGRYHLSQVQGELKFKVRKKRQWISSKYQVNIDMAITNISPGNPPKISLDERIKPATVMADQTFSYDPDFWGDYNTIMPESTLKEALERIEKSMQEVSSGGIAE